jgi:hypothetical protein
VEEEELEIMDEEVDIVKFSDNQSLKPGHLADHSVGEAPGEAQD